MNRPVIIPGSFDPITKGHIDVIERASLMFEEVYVLIAVNDDKKALFSLEERMSFVKDALAHIDNIKIDSYRGLTVDYYKKINAVAIVRGIRDNRDFDAEEEYDYYNRSFNPQADTLLMFSSKEFKYLSSSALKVLLVNDVNISKYVTPLVYEALKKKYKK